MKLGQVALTVEDLPRAVSFYRDVLELPFLFEYPNLAFFDLGGARLMLSGSTGSTSDEKSVLYFQTSDLHTTWTEMLCKGAQPVSEPHLIAKMPDHELWMAFVRDTDNRLTGIMSEVRN